MQCKTDANATRQRCKPRRPGGAQGRVSKFYLEQGSADCFDIDFTKEGGDEMPVIRLELWEGRTLDQKRELVKVLTRETARILNKDPGAIYMVIQDVPKENWGAGGELCSDKYPDT